MLLLALLVFTPLVCEAGSIVYADTKYGFDATDASTNFIAAFNGEKGTGNTLIFRDMGSPWYMTSPTRLFDISNMKVIFEPGFVLEAKRGEWPIGTGSTGNRLFNVLRAEDLTIIGYGAKFRMHRDLQIAGGASEYNHAMHIAQATRFELYGLTLEESGGDGIYVLEWLDSHIEDVLCTRHYRQGISVISARNLTIQNSVFRETSGVPPKDGLDFEPNNVNEDLFDIKVNDCAFIDNDSNGIHLAAGYLSSVSPNPLVISINRCFFSGNSINPAYAGGSFSVSSTGARPSNNYKVPITGAFTVSDSAIDSAPGRLFYSRKQGTGYVSIFNEVAAVRLAQTENGPLVYQEVPSYTYSCTMGGAQWNNVLLHTENAAVDAYYRVQGDRNSLEAFRDASGSFTVVAPSTVALDYRGYSSTDNVNVNIAMNQQQTLPTTTVTVTATVADAVKTTGQRAVLTFTRASTRMDYPLLVRYSVASGGLVQMGDDIPRLTGAVVIRTGQASTELSIRARNNGLTQAARTVTVTLDNTVPLYTVGATQSSATFTVRDTLTATNAPTTRAPTTRAPTTRAPTTRAPTTRAPTTRAPTTASPTPAGATSSPTTLAPTTASPTPAGATSSPTTLAPTTASPTPAGATSSPTAATTTTTTAGTTGSPTVVSPTASPSFSSKSSALEISSFLLALAALLSLLA